MGLKLITPPPVEPLTVAECYSHVQIDAFGSPPVSDHDDWLARTIKTVRREAEIQSGRALVQQVWEKTLDEFPRRQCWDRHRQSGCLEPAIKLPKPPPACFTATFEKRT